MGGAQMAYRQHWMDKFESPYLARLQYWRMLREYKAAAEAQAERDREAVERIERQMKHREGLLHGPRLVRDGDKDWRDV